MPLPEEVKRGGTEATAPKPIDVPGQSITIYATLEGHPLWPQAPSLAKEFLEQLEESKAPNGCIMLPGNMQYWEPCGKGIIRNRIKEPIHFFGPSP